MDDWQIFKGGSGQNCNTDKDAVAWVESPNLSGIGATEGIRMIDLIGFLGRVPSGFGAVQQKVEQLQPMARYELSFAIGTSKRFAPPIPPNGTPFYSVDVGLSPDRYEVLLPRRPDQREHPLGSAVRSIHDHQFNVDDQVFRFRIGRKRWIGR